MTTNFLRRSIAAIVAALLALMVAAPAAAHGQATLATCFVHARPGMTPAALFARPRAFDCTSSQAGQPQGDYWVLSQPIAATDVPMASVRTVSIWQHRVTLYVRYADGAVRSTGFTSATTAARLAFGAIIDLPLPQYPARPVRLLWHVEGSGGAHGIVVGARLAGHGERFREDLRTSVVYAVLGGMVLALFLYNLALWGALRQRFQPAYCAMLLLVLAYGMSSTGLLEIVTGMDNNRRLALNNVLLAATCIGAIAFAKLFFGDEVFRGRLRTASNAVMAALAASSTAFALLAPWWFALLDGAVTASFCLLILLVPTVLYRAWRVSNPYRWLFAFAWCSPVVFGALRIGTATGLVGWRFWIDNSTVPALAAEACLSALVITARIRAISLERDKAREQEIAARLLADTDPLTGLLNRRSFLAQAIGRVDDQALIVNDVDHFKQVNETIGHDPGDDVLRVVARALQAGRPADTLVARMGGEEFAILAPVGTAEAPADTLDRLRAASMPYDLTVTASIGSCSGPIVDEVDWKNLYRQADHALFEAKAGGRDRARHATRLVRAA